MSELQYWLVSATTVGNDPWGDTVFQTAAEDARSAVLAVINHKEFKDWWQGYSPPGNPEVMWAMPMARPSLHVSRVDPDRKYGAQAYDELWDGDKTQEVKL